jgi:hypothetical protein
VLIAIYQIQIMSQRRCCCSLLNVAIELGL